MKVGYCVPITPSLASYRLRVAIPAPLLGCEYEIGTYGSPSFFYKHFDGDLELAKHAGPFVYDVVNDHFASKVYGAHYQTMCGWAAKITCASEVMAATIKRYTGMDATVIDDPYENEEAPAKCSGNGVLWFGHSANLSSLVDTLDKYSNDIENLTVLSNVPKNSVFKWSLSEEKRQLHHCAVVLLTGNNPGASSNRVVKALRAGRFVVTPGGIPAWDAFGDYIWIGDVQEGIKWALTNREETCSKVEAGQRYLKEANSPQKIARQWMDAFASISPPATLDSLVGSPSTSRTATAAN